MSLRLYEELFIVKPDSTDEQVDPLIEQFKQLIEKEGGKVELTEKWGVRKLAYKLGKFSEGYYILFKFEATGSLIKEVERRLRVNDLVIKYLTVRLDEEMKWVEKRRKRREKRLARKPQVMSPAPGMAAGAPLPGAPAVPAAPVIPAEPAAPAPGKPGDADMTAAIADAPAAE